VINIHTRELTDELASLVKQVDALVDPATARGNDASHAFVVLLTDDADAAETALAKFAETHGIENTPMVVFDREAGPENYKIAKDAAVTVMMWKGKTVTVNHAFKKDGLSEDAVKTVVESAKEHTK